MSSILKLDSEYVGSNLGQFRLSRDTGGLRCVGRTLVALRTFSINPACFDRLPLLECIDHKFGFSLHLWLDIYVHFHPVLCT